MTRPVTPMSSAMARGECFITVDGWCATHSTGAGPVYCRDYPPDEIRMMDEHGASESEADA